MKPALKHLIGPLCATMALFALTAGYWYREDQETAVKRDEALDRSASIAQSLIAQRLERFESILRGVKGYYENSESVTPEEFKHYVDALHLDPVQVALKGIAIALRIDHVDKDRHTAAMQSTISDVYRIQPEGMRPQYTPIVLIEPLDATNEKALGFDISTNPTALEALQRSLPTVEAVLSGSTGLTQDAGKNLPAVVMYLPLMAKDGKHVLGWVSGPFRIQDLVAAVASGMDPDVDLVIHDGIAPSPANRMYGVTPADSAVPTVRLLEVGGRTWSLLLYTTTKFESGYANASHWFIAFIGGIASVLFGFAYWQMETGRARATTKALAMTRELRELEVVRQATLDAIPDLLFEADVHGVIMAYHAHRGDLLAAPPEVFMGKNFAEVLPAEATEVCMAAIRRAAVEGYATGAVYVLPLEQGDTWFEMSVSTLPETEGREKHFVLLTRDITERKVAELALKATNGQLQLLETCVARLNDIVLITEAEPFGDPGPRIVFVNDAFERRTGFSREEVIGKTPRILQGPKTDRKELDRIRAALERWEPVRAELLNYTKTGQEFWIELDIVPIADATGWFTHWVSIERDISERRQFELARQESEMRLRLVIRGGDIGFWDWDLRGSGLIVNERWCEMLGLDPKALALDIDVWNSRVHPDDAPTLVRLFEHVIQNPDGQGGEVEVRARHQAGHYVWILDRFSIVLRAADGTPLRAVGTHVDITERKVAELALQAALQEKTALLLEVHHRVKNNLQVITSLLRLESFRSTDAPTKSVLQDMQGRVRSMALLHETIHRKGTFAAIDLGSYAGQIAGESLKSMQVNPGAVRLQLDMEKLQVGLDQATPAGMLVSELIFNSLKHAFPEGRTGEICISLHPLDTSGQWRLRVSDSGIGLPADFEERCKTSLGLQLAFDMAKQMGGTLHIGAGPQAVFTVVFKAEVPAPLKINFDGVKP